MCLVTGCFFAGYWIRNRSSSGLLPLEFYLPLWPIITSLWIIALYSSGMYRPLRLKPITEIFFHIIRSAFISFVLFGFFSYLFKLTGISRSFVVIVFLLSIAVLIIEKILLLLFIRTIRRKGFNFRNVLIVGTNIRAQRFIRDLDYHRELGLKIAGVLDQDHELVGQQVCGYPVIGTFADLPKILEKQVIDYVILVIPRSSLDNVEPLIRHCETTGTVVSVAVDLFDLQFTMGKEGSLLGVPMITFESTPDKLWQLILKRLGDIALSATGLVIISPFYALIAIFIKTTSKGPIYFTQERCGLQGRRFKLYKFRTMDADAESQLDDLLERNEMEGPAFKLSDDPRVTPAGKILRKISIDELPQLWNVLRGDMSLVGPRPSLPREVEQYDHWQRRRLSMRPGITCLWQVNGRNNIVSFDQWAKLDLEYIDNWSLGLDFKILVRTIPAVISGAGAK